MEDGARGDRDPASPAVGSPAAPDRSGRPDPKLTALLADFARLEELPGFQGAEPLPVFEVWNEPDDERH